MKRYFIYTIIIFCLLVQPSLFVPTLVHAETVDELNQKIAEKKKKIEELEKNIEEYKDNVKQKQSEAVSLRSQLNIIDNHVARLQADVELTDEKIKKTDLEINVLSSQIKTKEDSITTQKSIIAKIMRDINKEESANYLEILLTNNNFSDFYDQIQYSQKVYQDLGRTAKGLRIAKEDLQTKKSLNEKYKKDQVTLKSQLASQKGDYSNQAEYKTTLLVQTKSSEWQYQVLLNNLKTQYQNTENEVIAYEREVQKKLAASEKIPSSGTASLGWPTSNRYITSYFHDPEYPYRNVFEHSGIDVAVSHGSPLYASGSGYVARARACYDSSCYSYVLIVHTGNLSTLYGHMSKINVSADQYVNKGDLIGYSGGTPGTVGAGPFVTGPHLHFEVRLNGIPVNALNYIK